MDRLKREWTGRRQNYRLGTLGTDRTVLRQSGKVKNIIDRTETEWTG